jgi:hypothetical protein
MKVRLLLLVVVLVASVVAAAGAGAATRSKTTVTIEGPQGDFQGEIQSPDNGCLGNRKVKVYKQSGSEQVPSADTVIASDTSERQGDVGVWSVGNTGQKKGRFYARVTKTTDCRGAFSETIKI